MSQANDPAFPLPLGNENIVPEVAGLTKRELFAAMIYEGMSAIPDNLQNRITAAQMAVVCADALLKALEDGK